MKVSNIILEIENIDNKIKNCTYNIKNQSNNLMFYLARAAGHKKIASLYCEQACNDYSKVSEIGFNFNQSVSTKNNLEPKTLKDHILIINSDPNNFKNYLMRSHYCTSQHNKHEEQYKKDITEALSLIKRESIIRAKIREQALIEINRVTEISKAFNKANLNIIKNLPIIDFRKEMTVAVRTMQSLKQALTLIKSGEKETNLFDIQRGIIQSLKQEAIKVVGAQNRFEIQIKELKSMAIKLKNENN